MSLILGDPRNVEIRTRELFPVRCFHLIDMEMRRNNGIERVFRSHLIGIRSNERIWVLSTFGYGHP